MNCPELDSLLCDYLDGTLPKSELDQVAAHLATCPTCAQLVADIQGVVEFTRSVEPVEPPPELITKIVVETRRKAIDPLRGWRSWWQRLWQPVLQPRFAMSMALTILSFSMVGRITGVKVQQLRAADLDPVKIWSSLDTKAHRVWEGGVKYYESLRLVYEVRTRLQEWSDQEEEERKARAARPTGAVKKESVQ